MRTLGAILFAAALAVALPARAQDYRLAATAAAELNQICAADRGRLWGQSLCGPLLVVDPQTRSAWASQPDNQGLLTQSGPGWIGTLPAELALTDAPLNWNGVSWIMLATPVAVDDTERRVELGAAAWRRMQSTLGLPAQPANCAHLDTERGRYLMRLELRALATALRSSGQGRRDAARDAVTFRMERLAEFASAASQEASLDRSEGLASYTGVILGAGEEAERFAMRRLDRFDDRQSLVRSYAAATGPGYGLLLDEFQPGWRNALGLHAPADLLVSPLRAQYLEPVPFERLAQRYGGQTIATEERERARAQIAETERWRARFAQEPRLVLDLGGAQVSYDPSQVTPLDGMGTIYTNLNARGPWGTLISTEGALISADTTQLVLPSPGPNGLSGAGWTLSPVAGVQVFGPDPAGIWRVALPPAE